jgi:uncharacterized protein YggT (Ycf19 family)
MLTLLDILKALLEVAGLALLGQGLLYLFAGAKRERNVVYQVFAVVTGPVLRLTRFIAPRFIVDQHIGLLAFLLVAVAWFLVLVEKQAVCVDGGLRSQNCAALAVEYAKRCRAGEDAYCEVLRRNGLMAEPAAAEQAP